MREVQGTMGGKDKEQWEGSSGNSGREGQGTVRKEQGTVERSIGRNGSPVGRRQDVKSI